MNDIDDVDELRSLITALYSDVTLSLELVQHQKTDFGKRVFIRAVFAFVEGMTAVLKQFILSRPTDSLSLSELGLVLEQSFDLDEQGRAVEKQARLRTLPNVRFSFDVCARSLGLEQQLPVTEDGWRALREALDVRHRL